MENLQITSSAKLVSVVVCTRDRPQQLRVAVEAILASFYRDFELVVVDQSTSNESTALVEQVAARDQRVRLVRDSGIGSSRARNIGIAATSGEIVIFTDDDCEPAPDWLTLMVEAMQNEPDAGIAFGSVIPGPHDPRSGFIVGYSPARRRRMTGRLAKLWDGGIGANMAIRRSVLLDLAGFDELLGPGAYFPSCEDGDMSYRVLAAGRALLHLPEARVLHHGLRNWNSGAALSVRTYVSIAAAYTKHARRGDVVGICLVLQQIGMAFLNVLNSLVQFRRPFGFVRLGALFVGVWRSFELDVDPWHGFYLPRKT